jgi:hypothetical protein
MAVDAGRKQIVGDLSIKLDTHGVVSRPLTAADEANTKLYSIL